MTKNIQTYNQTGVINDLSLLYELSLSIGTSLDLKENAEKFFKVLVARKNLTFASLWMQKEESKSYQRVYAYPDYPLTEKSIPSNHYILKRLKKEATFSITAKNRNFEKVVQEKNIADGAFAIHQLSDEFFIKIYTVNTYPSFDQFYFKQLRNVMNKFALSVKACLNFERLEKITLEKRKVEEVLESNINTHNLIINNNSDGILISDMKGNITFSNEQMSALSGYNKEQIIGTKVQDLVKFSQDLGKAKTLMKLVLSGKKAQTEVRHINKKTGKLWWTAVNAAPYRNLKGKLIGGIAFIQDITNKKETESALAASEAKLNSIFQSTTDKIFAVDKDYKLIAINKEAEKLASLFGTKKFKLGHKMISKNRKLWISQYNQVLKGKTITVEKNFTLNGIKETDVVSISPIKDKDQKIIGCTVFGKSVTALKEANKQSEERNIKFQHLFQQSPIGLAIFMPEQKGYLANDYLCEMLGYSHAEILKTPYTKTTHPEDLRKEKKLNKQLLNGDIEMFKIEKRYISKSGETIWANVTLSSLKDSQGNLITYLAIIENISAKKKAEATVKESEEKLRIIAENINEVFYIIDGEYNIKYLSPGIKKMLELNPDDLIGKNLFQLNLDYQSVQNYAKNNPPDPTAPNFKTELPLTRPSDGKIIWIEASGSRVFDKKGKLMTSTGVFRDITKKKQIELALIKTNKKYIDLFENMLDALLILDTEGNVMDANKSAQSVLGYPYNEIININVPRDLVHPDDRVESAKNFKLLEETGLYSNYVGRVRRKDGAYIYIQVNSNATYEDGVFTGSRDIIRDITMKVEADHKREKLFTELERVNKELKDFAYIVSHDLKAPLRAIASLTQWLQIDYGQLLDQKGQQYLDLLISRSTRMHNFIDGILQYSRLSREKMTVEKVNLNETLRNVTLMLNIPPNIEIKIKKELPTIICDRIRIEQIFQNLLSNSIKYNDKPKGRITINWKDEKTQYRFIVKDNGPGIEEKYHIKIFQIFQTLNARDQFESTGIGLTIVKRVVELHKGTIKLKSKPGKSLTFEFTINKAL